MTEKRNSNILVVVDTLGLIVRLCFLPLTLTGKLLTAITENRKDGHPMADLDVLGPNVLNNKSKKNPFSKN